MTEGDGVKLSDLEKISDTLANRSVAEKSMGTAFVCPNCKTHAHQQWGSVTWQEPPKRPMTVPATANTELLGARCAHCHRVSLWRGESCVFPLASVSEPAHKAMPAPVREVFEEARLVCALAACGRSAPSPSSRNHARTVQS